MNKTLTGAKREAPRDVDSMVWFDHETGTWIATWPMSFFTPRGLRDVERGVITPVAHRYAGGRWRKVERCPSCRHVVPVGGTYAGFSHGPDCEGWDR